MLNLRFTVMGPPVPKARARVAFDSVEEKYRGRTPTKSKKYEKHVGMLALAARSKIRNWPMEHVLGFKVEILLYVPFVKGDIDNILKSILDAMNKIIYKDDKLVDEIYIKRIQSKTEPTRAEISVTVVD